MSLFVESDFLELVRSCPSVCIADLMLVQQMYLASDAKCQNEAPCSVISIDHAAAESIIPPKELRVPFSPPVESIDAPLDHELWDYDSGACLEDTRPSPSDINNKATSPPQLAPINVGSESFLEVKDHILVYPNKTIKLPKQWKLDIKERGCRHGYSSDDTAQTGPSSKERDGTVFLRFKHISFCKIVKSKQASYIKKVLEDAFGPKSLSWQPSTASAASTGQEGGVLIIANKRNISGWEEEARNYYSSSFHSYTAPLSQRRKFGSARLSTFDVVISTLGILTAKECTVPAFSFMDDPSYSEGDGPRFRDEEGEDWLRRRKCDDMTTEASFLHLIRWKKIVIEVDDKTRFKPNGAKTEAILKLKGSVIEYHYMDVKDGSCSIAADSNSSGEECNVRRNKSGTHKAQGRNLQKQNSFGHANSGNAKITGVETDDRDIKTLRIFRDVSEMYNISCTYY